MSDRIKEISIELAERSRDFYNDKGEQGNMALYASEIDASIRVAVEAVRQDAREQIASDLKNRYATVPNQPDYKRGFRNAVDTIIQMLREPEQTFPFASQHLRRIRRRNEQANRKG